jgi:hypothetical protein
MLDVSKWRRRLSPQRRLRCRDNMSIHGLQVAAPVTDRRWIGSGIGLDLVGEVELHVPAGVDGISKNHLWRIRKYQPRPNC